VTFGALRSVRDSIRTRTALLSIGRSAKHSAKSTPKADAGGRSLADEPWVSAPRDARGASLKIVGLDEAEAVVRDAQAERQQVVLCHGCFDIVHPGHVRHLKEAARHGEQLIVSVTGDVAVNKGDGRPLIPQELRAENLAALDCVDWVVINPDLTAVDLLGRLRPDVYVKGREYEHTADPRCRAEVEAVRAYGGRVIFTSGDVVFSSTALIAAMEECEAPFQSRLRQLLAQYRLDPGAVEPVLAGLRGRVVVVVGEPVTETYVLCDRPWVADEAPLMTLRPVEHRRFDGGAAYLARQLAALGACVRLVTAVPPGDDGRRLERRLAGDGIDVRSVPAGRGPVETQRFLVGSTKVMKLEPGEPVTLDAAQQRCLVDLAVEASAGADAVLLDDEGRGLLSPGLLRELSRRLRPVAGRLVGLVTGRRCSPSAFHGLEVCCVSETALREALHNYDDGLTSVVWSLLGQTRSRSAVVALADDGAIAFDSRDDAHRDYHDWRHRLTAVHVPALTTHAVDQLGVDHAMAAATTLALCAGAPLVMAALIGEVAASVQAQRVGCAVIGPSEVRRRLRRLWDAQLAVSSAGAPHAVIETGDQLRPAHA
jgi:rfaE bifunctional protein nucleotidyltransferase chain/domain